jgi:hypothetical protein
LPVIPDSPKGAGLPYLGQHLNAELLEWAIQSLTTVLSTPEAGRDADFVVLLREVLRRLYQLEKVKA